MSTEVPRQITRHQDSEVHAQEIGKKVWFIHHFVGMVTTGSCESLLVTRFTYLRCLFPVSVWKVPQKNHSHQSNLLWGILWCSGVGGRALPSDIYREGGEEKSSQSIRSYRVIIEANQFIPHTAPSTVKVAIRKTKTPSSHTLLTTVTNSVDLVGLIPLQPWPFIARSARFPQAFYLTKYIHHLWKPNAHSCSSRRAHTWSNILKSHWSIWALAVASATVGGRNGKVTWKPKSVPLQIIHFHKLKQRDVSILLPFSTTDYVHRRYRVKTMFGFCSGRPGKCGESPEPLTSVVLSLMHGF
jgi:hypothetical protein